MRYIFFKITLFFIFAAAVGCVHTEKSPKTLAQWSTGEDDPKMDDEANGEPEEEKSIETDRPDFTEASTTVGKGRIQLESGYTYASDGKNGASHSYPEALFRIGMFADWFELRLAQNFLHERVPGQGVTNFNAGGDDFYFGCKLALTEQRKFLPESALILQATAPTGHNSLTSGQFLPGFNYLYGWDVIEDKISMGGSTQANRAVDGTSNAYIELAQSMTIGYSLTKKLSAYTEWFAFFPSGSTDPDTGPEHYFDGGFTYLLTNNFQLDIRAGVGLNRHADNFFVGSGFAVRY